MMSGSLSQITQLLQAGLGKDDNKLAMYRVVLQDPRGSLNNMQYRELAVEVLETLLDYTFNDYSIFTRLRQDLISDNRYKQRAFESIEEMEVCPLNRQIGTDSLVNSYRSDTPGQILKIIKKIVRKRKNVK